MEYRRVRVSTGLLESATFDVCLNCGVFVFDKELHDEHHETLDRISSNASRGETAWGMFQPLGGPGNM